MGALLGLITLKICDTLIEAGLIFIIIFPPLAYGAVQPRSIAVFEVASALTAFFFILKSLKSGGFEYIKNPLNPFIIVFLAYVFLQFLLPAPSTRSVFTGSSIYKHATKTEFLKLISYSLVFFVTLNTVKTRRRIARILSVIIAVGFLVSVLYLMRYFGVKAPRSLINRNHFSAYLAMIIPLALGLLFTPRDAVGSKPRAARSGPNAFLRDHSPSSTTAHCPPPTAHLEQRFLTFFCLIIMSAGLLFTLSRGGILSFIGALIFMAVLAFSKKFIRNKRWVLLTTLISIVLITIWIGSTPLIDQIGTIKTEIISGYLSGRALIWKATIDVIKKHPLFGAGLGTFNFSYSYPEFTRYTWIKTVHWSHAHNDFLELLSEVGLIGFFIFALCAIRSALYAFKRFHRRGDPWVVGLSIGFFGSLASIFLHSFTDFSLRIPANAVLLAIISALFISVLKKGDSSGSGTFNIPRSLKIIIYPLAVVLLAVFVWISIKPAIADYYFRLALKKMTDKAAPPAAHRLPLTELLDRAIKLDPSNARYHYESANLVLKQPFTTYTSQLTILSSALSKYRKAVELNPANGKYHQSLAWTYGRLADLFGLKPQTSSLKPEYLLKAAGEFETAISLEPDNPYRHRSYAIWLFNHPSQANIEKGVAEYRKAIKLDQRFSEEGLAKYYRYEKNYEKLTRILPGTKDTDCWFLQFLIKKEGLKFASDFAEKHLETYPDNGGIHLLIANKSLNDKSFSWEFTEKHYNIALKNAPESESANYRLEYGRRLYWKKEYEKSLKILKEAVELGLNSAYQKQADEYIEKTKIRLKLPNGNPNG